AADYCGPLFDDLEASRGWVVNPYGKDTATAGAWSRGIAKSSTYQLPAWSGESELATGRSKGDVDGGRTTVRSRAIKLPAGAVDLKLHYWVGMDARATSGDGLSIRLVTKAGKVLATALTVN